MCARDPVQVARIVAMNEEVVRRRVTVHGDVQGVFFRDSLRERADAHGVAGWAKNRSDGAVEAVLEGSQEAVDRVIRFCETGPPQAQVERTEVHEEEPEGLSGFDIG
jgi:acylphosphatase